MQKNRIRLVLFNTLVIMLLSLSACGGGENNPPSDKGNMPTGSELITKMKDAVSNIDRANVKVSFQFGTVDGAVKGEFELWAQRSNQTRIQITSEDESLNGMVVVSNEKTSWAFSPNENLVLVSENNQFKSQLNEQPELRDIIKFGETLEERGIETTQAETLGSETINGHETYKVQAKYDDPDFAGVTVIYYIDQKSFLPQKVEIQMVRDEVKISGFMQTNTEINTDNSIDASLFTFKPPDGAIVFDLNELPPLPDFSNSDIFKEE